MACADGVEVIFDPARIVVVVVVAELNEICRVSGPPHLAERCGRLRRHLVQAAGRPCCSCAAKSSAARFPSLLVGIVKDDDAAVLPRLPLPRGVGVQGKVKVKAAEADSPARWTRPRSSPACCAQRRWCLRRDTARASSASRFIQYSSLPVPVDIGVPLLRGGTQIDSGHTQKPPIGSSYAPITHRMPIWAKKETAEAVSFLIDVLCLIRTWPSFPSCSRCVWRTKMAASTAKPARSLTVPGMIISRPPAISAMRLIHLRSWMQIAHQAGGDGEHTERRGDR